MSRTDKPDLYPLVVLGTMEDPHVERVVLKVRAAGGRVFVLDYLNRTDITVRADASGNHSLIVDGTNLSSNYLVWDRMKIIVGTRSYVRGDESTSGFSAHEWRALYALMSGLNWTRVVNPIEGRACRIKPYQQKIAGKCGFTVPPTIVTTCKKDLIDFGAKANNQLVMKSLSGSKVTSAAEGEWSPYVVMTMKVDQEDIEAAAEEEVAFCPHFLQHQIMKSHELRVVVVGRKVMPFKIESQSSELTRIDWRKGSWANTFSRCDIPADLENKILHFMEEMGLVTGSIDIVVDKQGEHWFLECNQDGAWAWLDNICDGEVSDELARYFMRRMSDIDGLEEGNLPEPEKSVVSNVQ